jgi:hypothetical protein
VKHEARRIDAPIASKILGSHDASPRLLAPSMVGMRLDTFSLLSSSPVEQPKVSGD